MFSNYRLGRRKLLSRRRNITPISLQYNVAGFFHSNQVDPHHEFPWVVGAGVGVFVSLVSLLFLV
jgi:hypothetical protein